MTAIKGKRKRRGGKTHSGRSGLQTLPPGERKRKKGKDKKRGCIAKGGISSSSHILLQSCQSTNRAAKSKGEGGKLERGGRVASACTAAILSSARVIGRKSYKGGGKVTSRKREEARRQR